MHETDPKAVRLSADQRARLAALVRAFDASWDENRLSAAVSVLPPAGDPFRRAALAEMVKVDLGRQWRAGRRVTLDDYLRTYPELGTPGTVAADLRKAEEAARRAGETGQQVNLSARLPRQSEAMRLAVPEAAGDKPAADSRATPAPQGFHRKQAVELPEHFGRYHILKQLGQGGMGAVYLAEDTQLERLVALKVPHFDPQAGAEVKARFLREARAAAQFTHPNICPLHDVGEIDGVPYLTMPYIEGKTLADFVRPDKRLPQPAVAAVVRKLALALDEAHGSGFVHRDLKPSNVMVNQRKEPVIMDFGLARRHGGDASRVTGSGAVVGTPAYMAPEQIRNKGVGPASDQYSLGVLLYELLTGEVPFAGPVAAVLGQVLHSEPEPPSKLRPDLDPALEAICLRAMAKDPAQRFPSAKELADALGRFLDGARGKDSAASGQPRPAGAVTGTPATPTATSTSPPTAGQPRAVATQQMHALDVPPPTLVPGPAGSPFEGLDDDPVPAPKPAGRAPVRRPLALPPLWPLPPALKRRWPLVTAAAGGLAAVLLLGVVFLLRTPGGTLRIEVEDGGADVRVSVDGQDVVIGSGPVYLKPGEHAFAVRVNGQAVPAGQTVRLHLGQKTLLVKLGNAELRGQKFTVVRGANPVLRVELLPEGIAGTAPVANPWTGNDADRFFNGRDLSGWNGLPGYWRVEGGAIVGSSPAIPATHTCLFSDKNYKDFELSFRARLRDGVGNAGLQIRSWVAVENTLAPAGPQVDIGANFWGGLYGEALPGVGWFQQPDPAVQLKVKADDWNDVYVRCVGKHVTVRVNGVAAVDGDFPDIRDEGLIGWQFHGKQPPTEVAFKDIVFQELSAPQTPAAGPAGDGWVTLFDGTGLAGWSQRSGGAVTWRVQEGYLEVGRGDLRTDRSFGPDFHLHAEFWVPNIPGAKGQARGNSGIFLQGRHEIQILDSFGVPAPTVGDCGALYNSIAPAKNACLPPEQWQTYDIEFHAPRVDAAGAVTAPGRLTVVQNGVTVIDDQPFTKATMLALDKGLGEPGPILLQDHGNKVRFRNIRIKELSAPAAGAGGAPVKAGSAATGWGGFGGRTGAARAALLKEGGGDALTEAAVARGLDWIARQQQADGGWELLPGDQTYRLGATGLGLLPLLGDGQTHRQGGYAATIDAGLKYFVTKQQPDGSFGTDFSMYEHALATTALCEAYGLSGDAQLEAPARNAVAFLVAAQHAEGGWRYGPGQPGDTSVTGWQLLALKAAEHAGLDVPPDVYANLKRFLATVRVPSGGSSYMPFGGSASPACSAIGALGHLYLGGLAQDAGFRADLAAAVGKSRPATNANIYYWFWASQLTRHAGGSYWADWEPGMRDGLLRTQAGDATPVALRGSWPAANDAYGKGHGPLLVTSLSLLTLQVYYRHVPYSTQVDVSAAAPPSR